MKKLSIITINYNNREGLARTIGSVEAQTWRDFEWIVIDGGSTDGSKELIEEHAASFAYWVSEPDKGIYNAMNKGIRQAKGEWLQFLNSGDWLYETDTLGKVFSRDYKADVLYGDMVTIYPDGSTTPCFCDDSISLFSLRINPISHQATFCRRHLFDTSLYDESFRIIADYAKWVEWSLEGRVFEHLNQFVCYFDGNGISSHEGETLALERKRMLSQYLPPMLQPDYEKLMQQSRIEQRKSLRILSRWFYGFCNRTDNLLRKIESR